MWGFNWIDVIIIGLLVLAAIQGARVGILTQLFSITAFFGTLFLAGWIFPHILPIHDPNLLAFVNAIVVLLAAACAGVYGLSIGEDIHWSFRIGKRTNRRNFKRAESWSGIVTGILACLVATWFVGVGFSRLPFEGFSNSVSDSKIIQKLTDNLPPVPAVFAEFDKQFNPNGQPYVRTQPKPYPSFEYNATNFLAAETKASASVVRVTSFGCGGLVSGSGFVVAPNLIVTNAHVIAGVKRPIVKYGRSSYVGVPIYFDANLDLTILRVQHLNAPSLLIANPAADTNTTVAIVGYPGGNFTDIPGIIRDNSVVTSTNIYNEGSFNRTVYGIQATIADGSSGSPVVLPDGQVTGVIFSKSLAKSDYAYALSSLYLTGAVHKSKTSYQRVSTGACTLG
jgi:S1-C subfamily serine protease